MYSRSTSLVRIALATVLLAGLAACATDRTQPAVPSASSERLDRLPAHSPSSPVRQRSIHELAAATAVRQIGTPYRYGGADADGFDCSGLVYYSYKRAGKPIPRTTGSLWRTLPKVPRDELRTGDLLFFRIAGKVAHVGMYLDEHRFVHAPQSGRQVSIAKLDSPYYRKAFIGAGRP